MFNAEIQAKLTLDSLIVFLQTRDSSEGYNYIDQGECLLAQLIEAKKNGLRVYTHDVATELNRYDRVAEIPIILNKIALKAYGSFNRALKLAIGVRDGKLRYDEMTDKFVDIEPELLAQAA